MKKRLSFHPLGLPLGWQLLGIIIGALIVAQFVTLLLTIIIPPAPVHRWNIDEVAAQLLGQSDNDALERKTMSGPPDISGTGWLVSQTSREALAKAVNRPTEDVVLAFYTQMPVGGVTVPANEPQKSLQGSALDHPLQSLGEAFIPSAHAQAQPGGPPPGGMPGGGFPGGGFLGGPIQPMPGSRIPTGTPSAPVQRQPSTPTQPTPTQSAPSANSGAPANNVAAPNQTPPSSTPTGQAGNPQATPNQIGGPAGQPSGLAGPVNPPVAPAPTAILPPSQILPQQAVTSPLSDRVESRRSSTTQPDGEVPIVASPVQVPSQVSAVAGAVPTLPVETAPGAVSTPPADADAATTANLPSGEAVPIPFRRDQGLLSFTTPPFIEGDFIAAMKIADESWTAVAPRAEPFPNAWQRRVMLWFALSLLIVGPIMWAFARRIVRPLEQFSEAAEALGRDPSATVMSLSGPAEIGRAANAFNQMQNRLRAFVDDRTATVGAISHDLRTPLTRLRFRIEDVPDEQREALLQEVEEMESMISQVISYIRDASTPSARETVDLSEIVQSSVADARVAGGDVEVENIAPAPVDADAIGLKRLLANLLENALKYGSKAKVRVAANDEMVTAEIIDNGPGIPDDEINEVFTPFYRSEDARNSDKPGSGLGLAVCRSIARAHGGDVELERRADGFVARLSLPISFHSPLVPAA